MYVFSWPKSWHFSLPTLSSSVPTQSPRGSCRTPTATLSGAKRKADLPGEKYIFYVHIWGQSFLFWKKLISKDALSLSKVTVKTLYWLELFLFKIYFWRFMPLFQKGQYSDQKWSGRERGGGIGKGPQAGTWTRDVRSTTVLHVVALPTRLSMPTWLEWFLKDHLTLKIYSNCYIYKHIYQIFGTNNIFYAHNSNYSIREYIYYNMDGWMDGWIDICI